MKVKSSLHAQLSMLAIFIASVMVLSLLTQSAVIALPIAVGLAMVPRGLAKRRAEKIKLQLNLVWPEIIDHIVSGLSSGLSTIETLIQLEDRGPVVTRRIFKESADYLRRTGQLGEAMRIIRDRFSDSIADQVCETLLIARESGARDTTIILRTLGDYVRSDIALRSEIRAKHGWIRNSAVIATLAPWVLLLILSSQPTTIAAFSTLTGAVVLLLGFALSVGGFFWMSYLGRSEEIPRVFAVTEQHNVRNQVV